MERRGHVSTLTAQGIQIRIRRHNRSASNPNVGIADSNIPGKDNPATNDDLRNLTAISQVLIQGDQYVVVKQSALNSKLKFETAEQPSY